MKKIICYLLVGFLSLTAWAKEKNGVYAKISTTKGEIMLKLEFEKTPLTVANFIGLAEGTKNNDKRAKGKPYYDGLTFHRVIKDFMVQGGDPAGNGSGGPGYRFRDEFDSSLKHNRPGTLSMANAGAGTNGSQFFITHKATPWLNNRHTVFGYVTKGQDVVDKIRRGDLIKKLEILRVGKKAQAFRGGEEHFQELRRGRKQSKTEKTPETVTVVKHKLSTDEKVQKYIKENFSHYKEKKGLRYSIEKKGKGPKADVGQRVKFFYRGRILGSQGVFANNFKQAPVSVKLGAGLLIEGMEKALLDMKKGERRRILIPPYLGFGSKPDPSGRIPGNSYLLFEIELKGLQ